ncbi:MAG: hypothetical protein KHX55_04300 [Proteobacteria bacterium]|nr:hypothetical protein [Pseudomonadota bacterium]
MADLISLDEINTQIENTDYSNPANVEELRRLLERADAAYAVSNQYDRFIDVRKKYEEKLRNPQAAQDSAANAAAGRSFDQIRGNQERREYLEAKINRETDLVLTPNERAFLAEQIANGNMYDQLQDGEKILKIARALDSAGYEKTVRDNVLRQLEKPDQSMMPADKAFVPNANTSFGEQILKELDNAAPKETLADLQQQVARLAANVDAYGETQGNMSARRELIGKIRELQEEAKGIFNYNTRRKLNNQLKKIDPNYYDTQIVNSSAIMRPYYRTRAALRDWNARKGKDKTERLEKRYDRVTTLQNVINQNSFWSRNMGANISARFKLLGNCLAEGRLSAQGVTNKYAKRLNLTDTGRQLENIDAKLSGLKAQNAENPKSRERLNKQIAMLEAQKEAFSKQSEKVSGKRKDKIDQAQTQAEPVKQKVRERLEKMASGLEKSRLEAIKSSDRYKALTVLQSRSGLSAEQKKELDAMVNGLTEKAITAENVYEKILLESGLKGDELAAKVAELFPPREADDQQQQPQARDSEALENENNQSNDDAQRETTVNTVVTHEERRDGEVVTTYASGLEVSRPDENTYNISGKDGKNPTDEQCAEFVNQLKQDNYESFSVAENVTPEFYASMVKAAEAAGMTIENKEQMDKKFAQEINREGMGGDERTDGSGRTSGGSNDENSSKLERNDKGDILLTEVQQQALDAEGRGVMGGEKKTYDKLDSHDKAYLEEEGLGQRYTNGVRMGREIMADAEISAKDITVEKMDLLMDVQKKEPEEFEEFKKSEAYRNLPAGQRKLVDAVNALANNQEFKSKDEKKQAIVLGRVVGQYKASVEKEKTEEGKKKAKERFVDRNIVRHLQKSKSNS